MGNPEDFEADFLTGIAQLLAGGAAMTWKPTGSYSATETGIVIGGLPQSPDRVIALGAYGVSDDPSLSDSVIGLQVTTRWGGQNPTAVGKSTGLVFNALHGRTQTDLSTGIRLVQCLRKSWTSLGQDNNNRWRTVQNFYCDVHRPTAHRT